MGWVALGCVLGATGCRMGESRTEPTEPAKVIGYTPTETVAVEQRETAAPQAPAQIAVATPPEQERTEQRAEPTPEPAREPTPEESRKLLEEEDRIWLSETAEAARAGNPNIAPGAATEDITIATGTVDGRVERVRKGTIEVSDGEGNIYELRIDKRSRGLRQGRQVPLRGIAEGTPVRASFDLVGAGDSLARDIVLRR
ncbi:hypothetical protein MEBOL_004246 [Melittangium boletus DSM 14713]|uniref:Uncharacterized protein n=2 Tax=Melittangium boletus TaxID=83453 RepID=A0A250IG28_9BACT|nr:hypothetical protein MEBOL_004246 [Melittangium boletus DSM 14713]